MGKYFAIKIAYPLCESLHLYLCGKFQKFENMDTNNNRDYEKMSQVKLIDKIISLTQKKKLSDSSLEAAMPYIKMFAQRADISDDAAMIFASFFNKFADRYIYLGEIAEFYKTTQVKILIYWPAIEELMNRKYLSQMQDRDGDTRYSIPNDVVKAIRSNTKYIPKDYKNLKIDQWIGEFSVIMENRKNDMFAIMLNQPEATFEDMVMHGVTAGNTGLKDRDYYKGIEDVKNNDLFKDENGKFSDVKFNNFYDSVLKTYNAFSNEDYEKKVLENLAKDPLD